MLNVLLDTDVILDFFFDREPYSRNAAQLLSLCENKQIVGLITPVIVSNVYYLLSRKANHEKVMESIKKLLLLVDILLINKNTILVALNSEFKDFEDALQNYASELNGNVDIIITRNTRDFQKSKIKVMTPTEFLNHFAFTH